MLGTSLLGQVYILLTQPNREPQCLIQFQRNALHLKSETRGPGWHPACAVGTISVVAPLTRGLRSMCRLLRDTCGVVAGAKVERPRPRYIHAFRRPPAANDRVRASALPGDLPRRRMRTYSITVLARCSPTCGGGRSACQCMSCRRCERSGASGAGTPSTLWKAAERGRAARCGRGRGGAGDARCGVRCG